MTRERDEPFLDDPLLRELIPTRITPPPTAVDGPTARWLASLESEAETSRSDVRSGWSDTTHQRQKAV